MDFMGIADRSWPVIRRVMKAHTFVYRTSGGLVGHRLPGTPPMLLLHHTGAKSGAARTDPLVYVRGRFEAASSVAGRISGESDVKAR